VAIDYIGIVHAGTVSTTGRERETEAPATVNEGRRNIRIQRAIEFWLSMSILHRSWCFLLRINTCIGMYCIIYPYMQMHKIKLI